MVTRIYCDNTSTIKLFENHVLHGRIKHTSLFERTRVYFLQEKFEAFAAFKIFRVNAEKKSDSSISMLCPDHGGEFSIQELASFCETYGIKRSLQSVCFALTMVENSIYKNLQVFVKSMESKGFNIQELASFYETYGIKRSLQSVCFARTMVENSIYKNLQVFVKPMESEGHFNQYASP